MITAQTYAPVQSTYKLDTSLFKSPKMILVTASPMKVCCKNNVI